MNNETSHTLLINMDTNRGCPEKHKEIPKSDLLFEGGHLYLKGSSPQILKLQHPCSALHPNRSQAWTHYERHFTERRNLALKFRSRCVASSFLIFLKRSFWRKLVLHKKKAFNRKRHLSGLFVCITESVTLGRWLAEKSSDLRETTSGNLDPIGGPSMCHVWHQTDARPDPASLKHWRLPQNDGGDSPSLRGAFGTVLWWVFNGHSPSQKDASQLRRLGGNSLLHGAEDIWLAGKGPARTLKLPGKSGTFQFDKTRFRVQVHQFDLNKEAARSLARIFWLTCGVSWSS